MGAIGDLSLAVVDILWEDLKLGDFPFPLEIPSHGDTVEERARIRAAVYAQLENRGLAEHGRPTQNLDSTLRLLAAPHIGIDLVALGRLTDRTPIRALVAVRGRRAVCAVQRDLAITVRRVRETEITAAIVDLLPANRPGPGQSVTLPAAVLSREAAPRPGRHRRADAAGGVLSTATVQADHTTQRRFLDSVMERPIVRGGSIGIVLRDEHGRTHRLPGLTFFDNDQGRYTTSVIPGGDGEDWTTLTPADNPRVAHRLNEILVTALRSGTRT